MSEDPIAAGAKRLALARVERPDAVDAGLTAAERYRAPRPDDLGLPPTDLALRPSDLGFAVVDGSANAHPKLADGFFDGTIYTVVAVDAQGRAGALDVYVTGTDMATHASESPEVFVVDRVKSKVGSISNNTDRFAELLALHPLHV